MIYYAAACQTDFMCPKNRSEIQSRTERMCDIAKQTIIGYEPFYDVRLLAFPEFAHTAPIYESVKGLRANLSVSIPNEHTDQYEKVCKEYGCYIQTGTFIEEDKFIIDKKIVPPPHSARILSVQCPGCASTPRAAHWLHRPRPHRRAWAP